MNIQALLLTLGFRTGTNERQIILHYINNPEGTVRWCWPATARRPLFLKFYNDNTWRSGVFTLGVRVIFFLRLTGLFFRKISCTAPAYAGVLAAFGSQEWAAFSGTPGPNRKVVILTHDNGRHVFIKIPLTATAKNALHHEYKTLEFLRTAKPLTFAFPAVMQHQSGILTVSDISGNGHRTSRFSAAHQQALHVLRDHTLSRTKLDDLEVWKTAKKNLAAVKLRNDPRIPKGMVRKLEKLIQEIDAEQDVDVCLSHGDFTPWNIYFRQGQTLAVYDWELSQPNTPVCYDAFHFVIQQGILVHRKPWLLIQRQVQELILGNDALFRTDDKCTRRLYLKLYLIIHISRCLTLYQHQHAWHRQISWLLQTWNEALSSMLAGSTAHRKLLLMDLVDFLATRRYAVLKYHNALPESLAEFSDMDICITRHDYAQALRFLQKHVLMRGVQAQTRSCMASLYLNFTDRSSLHIDFIWQLRRKQFVMMDIEPVLERATTGWHGVTVAAPRDEARYIALFYGLNNACVPEKYLHYRAALAASPEKDDHFLMRSFSPVTSNAKAFREHIGGRKENRGMARVYNTVRYWLDVAKQTFGTPGIIITFSGVDGAGKSTVIEMLRAHMEKKLRKRVVVLRHRPSLLPILSAWSKGKAQAEREAARTLPRTGTNESTLSSLARFAYYYTDYMLGQLYVLCRYVLPGYVVLYDRYYFDFMIDSRRSNITLPAWLPRLGYCFILNPDYNFFLYASPEQILSRKEELDTETIRTLTDRYLSLFQKLNKRPHLKRYVAVQNVDLSATVQEVITRISSPTT